MKYLIEQGLEGAEYFFVDADSLEEAKKKYLESPGLYNGFDRYVQDADMRVDELICENCGKRILRGGVFYEEGVDHIFRCDKCNKKLNKDPKTRRHLVSHAEYDKQNSFHTIFGDYSFEDKKYELLDDGKKRKCDKNIIIEIKEFDGEYNTMVSIDEESKNINISEDNTRVDNKETTITKVNKLLNKYLEE